MNRPMRMKRIIKYLDTRVVAVTGGIGSGQSTVCDYLTNHGCKVIDVDRRARRIIEKDTNLQQELRRSFGNEIFDNQGQLKRRVLASLIFDDSEKIRRLNRLVHPQMVAEIIEELEEARFSHRYPLVVVDAALIFELNMEKMFDAIIVVHADLETRIQRVIDRDGLNRTEIMARIQQQIPQEDKISWATYDVDNNGSMDDLKKQIGRIFEKLTADMPIEKRIRI